VVSLLGIDLRATARLAARVARNADDTEIKARFPGLAPVGPDDPVQGNPDPIERLAAQVLYAAARYVDGGTHPPGS
jgi:hypothetical protein